MKPGDYVIYPTADHVTYFWRVSGVYYGGMGQESVVGLQCVTTHAPTAHGDDIEEMFVPIALVQDHVFEKLAGSGNLRGSARARAA
jgi:hypothetical protein